MPYITQARRIAVLDLDGDGPRTAGELNFVITKIVFAYITGDGGGGLSYASINEAIGALECAKLELYRRVAAPYENVKLSLNGDVYGE